MAISFFGLYIPLYIGKIPSQNADIQKEVQYIRINSKPVPVGIIVQNVKKYNLSEHSMSDKELSEKMQATLIIHNTNDVLRLLDFGIK